MKQPIMLILVDFKMAFDSVDRRQRKTPYDVVIYILKSSALLQKSSDDKTTLYLSKEKQVDTDVTCGIKQGCNGSTIVSINYIICNYPKTGKSKSRF